LFRVPLSHLVCGCLFWVPVSCLSQEPDLPKFVDGQAEVVEAFKKDWLQHDLWVETEFDSDGDGKKDRMHVSVTRPGQTESQKLKVPVIYQSSPYYSGMGSTKPEFMWSPKQELGGPPPEHESPPSMAQKKLRPVLSKEHINEWVPRGYAVVHSSSPGTGLSQGCVTVGGDNESLAPKAVIDWLCGRAKGYTTPDEQEEVTAAWSTGKVGMTGTSYNGTLALAAATTGVEGLMAIIPVAPNTSYYHYYRSNGLVRHPGGYMGEDIDVLYNFVNSGDPAKREYCDCNIRDIEMKKGFDREHGDYNAFWEGRDYLHKMKSMKAALLMAHAFNDWNVMPEHSIRIYEAAKKQGLTTQLYMHQGGHGGQPPIKMMNRWFTRFLYGIENDVEKDAQAWIVREGGKMGKPEPYTAYPHPDAKIVPFYLSQDGLARGAITLEPVNTPGTQKWIDNYSFSGAQLAKADWSNHRLIFASPKLKESVHLSGTAKLTVQIACNRPAVNLSAWLVSLPWTDSEKLNDDIITRGWADPTNHLSIAKEEPMQPNVFRKIQFELQPDDQVIPAGEQIALMVFSSDRDFTLWPTPGTEVTLDPKATQLELPIVGGAEAWRKATN
jgi:X-Pro dipeptidyl-peptidase